MLAHLIVNLLVKAIDRCVFDGPVHPLDLTVGPRMLGFGRSVIDVVPSAGTFEGMGPEAFTVGQVVQDRGVGQTEITISALAVSGKHLWTGGLLAKTLAVRSTSSCPT